MAQDFQDLTGQVVKKNDGSGGRNRETAAVSADGKHPAEIRAKHPVDSLKTDRRLIRKGPM